MTLADVTRVGNFTSLCNANARLVFLVNLVNNELVIFHTTAVSRVHQEDDVLLVSGVATARPVGEQRPCCDSDQHPWLCLQPAFNCPSTLLLPGRGTLGTSDLKQHSYGQMEQKLRTSIEPRLQAP